MLRTSRSGRRRSWPEGRARRSTFVKTLPAASGHRRRFGRRGGGAAGDDGPARHRADGADRAEGFETRAADILALGADVPMCLFPRPLRARGIGERIDPVALPTVAAVLVNPRVALAHGGGLPRARSARQPGHAGGAAGLRRCGGAGRLAGRAAQRSRRRRRSGCSRWWPRCSPRSRRRGACSRGCRGRGPPASGSMRDPGRRRPGGGADQGRAAGLVGGRDDAGRPDGAGGAGAGLRGFAPPSAGLIHCQPSQTPPRIFAGRWKQDSGPQLIRATT
jgi:hypothetical protein